MEAARKRLWLKAGGIAVVVFAAAAAFSAYLGANMVAVFADAWSFCAGLVR